MAHYEIEILIENGKLEYACETEDGKTNARSLVVLRGSTVSWTCKFGDYTIQFANNTSPLADGSITLSKLKGMATDPCMVRWLSFPREPFKYTVAVYVSNGTPRILVDDPIIIVEDA